MMIYKIFVKHTLLFFQVHAFLCDLLMSQVHSRCMLTRVHLIFKALHSCSPFFYSGQDTVYLRDNFPHLIFISKSNWHINQICIISAHFGKPVLKYTSRTTFLPLSLDDHTVILSHTFIKFFSKLGSFKTMGILPIKW